MWEADAAGAGDAEQRLESGRYDFRWSIGGVFIGFSERGVLYWQCHWLASMRSNYSKQNVKTPSQMNLAPWCYKVDG